MSQLSRNKIGLTLIEVLLSVVVMGVVFLAVSALYVASQNFYFTVSNKTIISYELQYAVDHIYKYAMQGIGDNTSPAIPDPGGGDTLEININSNDPLTQANYGDTIVYTYSKSGSELIFDDGVNPQESLASKIEITDVSFNLEGNLLTISITGSYKDEALTFYSACYPRLASF